MHDMQDSVQLLRHVRVYGVAMFLMRAYNRRRRRFATPRLGSILVEGLFRRMSWRRVHEAT